MNFKIFGLAIIAILAIGSVSAAIVSDRFVIPKTHSFLGENAIQPFGFQTKDININIGNKTFGESFIISLDGTDFAGANDTKQMEILSNIKNYLDSTDFIDTATVNRDSSGKPYIEATSKTVGEINHTVSGIGTLVIGDTLITYNLVLTGKITKIKTSVDFTNIDSDIIIPSSRFTGHAYGLDYGIGRVHYDKKGLNASNIKITVTSPDGTTQIINSLTDENGTFNFNLNNITNLADGMPGTYKINASVEDSYMYVNSVATKDCKAKDKFFITAANNQPSNYGLSDSNNNVPLTFSVKDYYNNPIKNQKIVMAGTSFTTDGAGSFTYNDNIVFNPNSDDTEITKNYNIGIPTSSNNYTDGYGSTIKYVKLAGSDKSVCLRTENSGSITSTRTFNAPNGMSITAKGGSLGFIAMYYVKFYDVNGDLISEKVENYYEVCASDRKIDVPSNAAYMDVMMGGKSTGKSVYKTGRVSAGNGIVYFEGLAGTENGHMKVQNANGREIISVDKHL
ncbi:MAG: hypothetical protein CfClM3_1784 [Methanobrevibacter sp. CfCl-M3]